MAERLFIFRAGSTELTLPVTPDNYRVSAGTNIEVVNIHQLGDAVLSGYGTLATITVDCMFPAKGYRFAMDSDPEHYIRTFTAWIKDKKKLRFIVSDTGVNVQVLVENISYGERDGTNDVYATIILREYRQLEAVQLAATPQDNAPREAPVKSSSETVIEIKYGDTLSALCAHYYGDASAATYTKLAEYNDIQNPHLIYAGRNLKIPQPLL